MLIRIVIGIMLGAAIGALVGKTQSCQSGACPLTANPRRGAIWGGLLGLMFALSFHSGSSAVSESNKTTSTQTKSTNSEQAIIEVSTMDAFKREVLARPGKTVVDFFATWCPPCKQYSPILDKMAEEKLPGVSFVKVDVDKAQDIAQKYGIEAMPTTIVFENGNEVKRFLGAQFTEDLKQALGV